jgi:acetylglutamate kinase
MQPRDVVHRFLTGVGRRSEAESYLAVFRAARPESFAVIAADDDAVRDAADALVVDLVYLARLDLRPVTVVGQRDFAEILRDWLADDVEAHIVIDAAGATEAVHQGALPLVVAARDRLGELTAALETRKLLLIGPWRGLEPRDRPVPSIVDVVADTQALLPQLSERQAELLRFASDLLVATPHAMSIAITSPFELLRELFTVRGAGTLLRRGAAIARHADFDGIDRARLAALLSSAFGRTPLPVVLERKAARIYIAGDYRGAAIVTDTELGPYLSKFAVERIAQGEGLGSDLWRALAADHPELYWRARQHNPITPWYIQQCDGMARRGPWCVFWRGLAIDRVPAAVARAEALPDDFEPLP